MGGCATCLTNYRKNKCSVSIMSKDFFYVSETLALKIIKIIIGGFFGWILTEVQH
jgi:hypothetical protein